jgi:hypothetical protein
MIPALEELFPASEILPLLLRMGVVAAFVVTVALVAERLGPFFGGMLASLPLNTGPVYVLLALEHDAAYFSRVTVASTAICGAIPVFVLIYAILARSQSAVPSVVGAMLAWLVVGAGVQAHDWSLVEALLFVTPIYLVSLPLAQGFTRGVAIRGARRRPIDLVLRAAFAAGFTGIVIVTSRHVPPAVTGVLAVMPILMASLALVMHPRVGGPATAALMAHTLVGIVGMVVGFSLVHATVETVGVWQALALGLLTTVIWNAMLITVRHLRNVRAA